MIDSFLKKNQNKYIYIYFTAQSDSAHNSRSSRLNTGQPDFGSGSKVQNKQHLDWAGGAYLLGVDAA